MKPKITIITVCYNSEKYIEQAILSVINQTYENLEYIVVDGGSQDDTMNIVNRYRDKISIVISEKDKGISDAFNKGIRNATGDIIGIVNSDDMLYNNHVIEKLAEYYEPDIDVYRGREIVKNFDSGYEYILSPSLVFKKNPITFHVCHMATYIKKDAFERFGFYNEDFRYAMDMELLYRFNYKGAKTKGIDLIIGTFRIGGVSQTYNKNKRTECEKIIRTTGGSYIDAIIYRYSLIIKDMIRKFLNLFGVDLASRIRYGRNR